MPDTAVPLSVIAADLTMTAADFSPPCLGWTGDVLDAARPAIHQPMTALGYQMAAVPDHKAVFEAITWSFIATRDLPDLVHNAVRLMLEMVRHDPRLRIQIINQAAENGEDAGPILMDLVDELINMVLAVSFYDGVYDSYSTTPLFATPLAKAKRRSEKGLWTRPISPTLGLLDDLCLELRYRFTAWPKKKG